jgi:hypothetical protein
MKKRGSLFGYVTDVTDGWIDIRLRTGGTATVFSKYDFGDKLKKAMRDMQKSNICLEFICGKTKDGTYMYGSWKKHAGARLKHTTERVKADAELRKIEMECTNFARGRSSRISKSTVSLAASNSKKGKVNYTVRQLVTGAVTHEGKPVEFLP